MPSSFIPSQVRRRRSTQQELSRSLPVVVLALLNLLKKQQREITITELLARKW
jgi:hypothetical protein